MKTTRITIMVAALAGLIAVQTAAADPHSRAIRVDERIDIQPYPHDDLQVWIWPDRGEGAEYYPGDRIEFNVEVTRDCFLILYDIDTRGNLRILFPYDPWDNNFVEAGRIIRFPRPRDGYDWTVDGPSGIEYVQAIASEFPIAPPDWPVYIRSVNHGGAVHYDHELRDFRAGDDHLAYIRVVNRKITGRYHDWCATDLASFIVRPRYHRRVHYDPWPDIFYGEIYIGWPIGCRIYIDDVYIGVAPLWVPRHYYRDRHVIKCYRGERLLRRQVVHYYPKRSFRFDQPRYKGLHVKKDGYVRTARRGGAERFGREIIRHHSDKSLDRKKTEYRRTRKPLNPRDRKQWENRSDLPRREPQRGQIEGDKQRIGTRSKGPAVRLESTPKVPGKTEVKVKRQNRDQTPTISRPPKVEQKKERGFLKSVTSSIARSVEKAASKSRESVSSERSSSKSGSSKAKVSKKETKVSKSAVRKQKSTTVKTKSVKKATKRSGKRR
jgi:hypothetical protein